LEDTPGARRFLVEGRIADIPFRQWTTFTPASRRLELRLELEFASETYLGPQLEDSQPGTPYYVERARKLCINFATSAQRASCPRPSSCRRARASGSSACPDSSSKTKAAVSPS